MSEIRKHFKEFDNVCGQLKLSEYTILEDFVDFVETQGAWKRGLPKEVGNYWLWSYRYGKVSCGESKKPEMMFMKARLDGTKSVMYTADGQFLYKSEVEEPYYMKIELPKPPYEG